MDFNTNGKYSRYCSNCRDAAKKEVAKRYYQKNKAHIKQRSREHYRNNRDARRESHKKWRGNNKEYIAKNKKEYYKTHRDEMIRRATKYIKNNGDKHKMFQEKYYKKNRSKLLEYRKNNILNINGISYNVHTCDLEMRDWVRLAIYLKNNKYRLKTPG
jgi:hypothetical protein